MTQPFTESTVLSNGVKMPWLGLGVWKVKDDGEAERTVASALELGYRSIDTAAAYNNEVGVGAAIRNSAIPREQIFVTTKIWNANQGYDTTLAAFEESRRKLGFDVIDLILIHWPVEGKYKETWRALEKLYKDGAVRAIGVSNFQIHHLKEIEASGEVTPMVNQVEYHPLLSQSELRAYCQSNGIQLEAWSPLMQGNLDQSVLADIGAKHGKSAAQIVLRWDLQNKVVTIPKSTNPARMQENAAIFDFELSADDMAQIDGLNRNQRFGPDPDNFSF